MNSIYIYIYIAFFLPRQPTPQKELYHHTHSQPRLPISLYLEKRFDTLLCESPGVAQRREATAKLLEALTRAQAVLSEVKSDVQFERGL